MYRIGVYGSSEDSTAELGELAARIGSAIAVKGCGVITGACSGLPYRAAFQAARLGAEVWGFSPMSDMEGQRRFTPHDDLSIYSELRFLPPDFIFLEEIEVAKKYRNVLSPAHCDAGIIISGRWGTLHEACSLIDYGKVVGALIGSGGVADELTRLWEEIGAGSKGCLVSDENPEELVRKVVEELDRRKIG